MSLGLKRSTFWLGLGTAILLLIHWKLSGLTRADGLDGETRHPPVARDLHSVRGHQDFSRRARPASSVQSIEDRIEQAFLTSESTEPFFCEDRQKTFFRRLASDVLVGAEIRALSDEDLKDIREFSRPLLSKNNGLSLYRALVERLIEIDPSRVLPNLSKCELEERDSIGRALWSQLHLVAGMRPDELEALVSDRNLIELLAESARGSREVTIERLRDFRFLVGIAADAESVQHLSSVYEAVLRDPVSRESILSELQTDRVALGRAPRVAVDPVLSVALSKVDPAGFLNSVDIASIQTYSAEDIEYVAAGLAEGAMEGDPKEVLALLNEMDNHTIQSQFTARIMRLWLETDSYGASAAAGSLDGPLLEVASREIADWASEQGLHELSQDWRRTLPE
jgi:hypothetical protein